MVSRYNKAPEAMTVTKYVPRVARSGAERRIKLYAAAQAKANQLVTFDSANGIT